MKRIYKFISLLIVLTYAFVISASTVFASELVDYNLVADNQYLTLFFNEATAEIAVYHKHTAEFWHSNPVNYKNIETIARGAAKDGLGAQLRITYFSPGDVQRTMDSYNDSIVHGQYEFESIENGLRVTYTIGKEWDDLDFLPLLLEQSFFESQFFSRLDLRQQQTILGSYALIELVEAETDVTPTVGSKYIIHSSDGKLSARELRTIHNVFLDHIVKLKTSLSKVSDIKDGDVQPFLGTKFYILKQRERDMLPWDKDDIISITKAVDFTPHIIGEGNQFYNLESPQPSIVVFTIPVEYRLDKDNLVVNILTEGINYPQRVLNQDGLRVTYPLVQIALLPYFGAAKIGSNGYMFVPDGSGSLINFDNGKTHFAAFSRRVYGQDYAVNNVTTGNPEVITRSVHLPVFGLKNSNNALFAVIESGASIARINADVSGRRISYNTVYPSFEVIERTTASLQSDMPDIHRASAQWVTSGGGTINVYQEPMYDGDIQVRYTFLSGEHADYVGMANYYQNYLIEKGYLKKLSPKNDIPLMLELIGAVQDRKPIMGIPRDVIVPLTTYNQVESTIETLLENQINNLHISYLGWMKNGLESFYPTKVRLEPKLGNLAEFQKLLHFANENQVFLYPNVDFMSIYNDTWFDGFFAVRDATRAVTRNVVSAGGYLLSPTKLEQLIAKYLKSQSEYRLSGIQPTGLGDLLYGDYRKGAVVTRETAIRIIQSQLAKMGHDYNLRIQTYLANDYALPYVTSILGVPLEHSGLDITDQSIPFLPILLHGFIEYSGEALNYADGQRDYLLKMIEVGAKPYFRVFYESPTILKGTFYDSLYTGQFDQVLDGMLETYHLLNQIFNEVQDQRIIKHSQIADNVFKTVYENGLIVIVNYNQTEVVVEGIKILPKGFVSIK